MMNYAVEIKEVKLSDLCSRAGFDSEEKFLRAAKFAEGKSVFQFVVLRDWAEEKAKQLTLESRPFKTDTEKLKAFGKAMKTLADSISELEKKHPSQEPVEKSLIITG